MNEDSGGIKNYIDIDRIKVSGNVYYWTLTDYLKPDKYGDLSAKLLYESDCNLPEKRRVLSQLYYTQPMGQGATSSTSNKVQEWRYPTPSSSGQYINDYACYLR